MELKDNEFPFEINFEENKIISKRTELKYDYKNNDYKDIFKNIYFTRKFAEICDLIHFSCTLNIPLILEGETGQGKKTAINLMSQFFDLEVIHKVLSKSTKSDELLMNMIITKSEDFGTKIEYKKTDISEALEEKNSKKIIIFDEINNASLPVLDLLTNIIVDKKALLPDGSELKVGNPNIIGIINRNNNESLSDRIPMNLKSNCIYHIVENPDGNDFSNIITKLFSTIDYDEKAKKDYTKNYILNNEIMNESQRKDIFKNKAKYEEYYRKAIEYEFNYFSKKFITSLNFIQQNSIEPTFNLIDIKKYIDFRKSNPKINQLYLMLFIFVYRFDKREIQEKMENILNLKLTDDFNPYIDYDENQKKLIISLGKNKFDNIELKITNSKNIKKLENKRLFSYLTKIQKLGIIFLICCIQSGRIPLIQGETASGKSYLMKIFSKLFGQEMILYQITSNSGISIITGQDIIRAEIDKDEKEILKNNFKKIRNLIEEKKSFKNLKEDEYPSILTRIINKLKKNNKCQNLKKEDIEKLNEAKNSIKNIVLLSGRLAHKKSSFIKAAEEGGWVFLDGIEMGHSILFDTISSLCNENPQLNVLGSEETISLNKDNIAQNFKFFLTFNPTNLGKKTINKNLFNSCARFSLTSLDSFTSDATLVLYNCRYEDNINPKLWGKICSKLAFCHKINVEKSEVFLNSMAGGIKFSPRHLTFLGFDGKKCKIQENSQDISNWIKSIFQLYYLNSYDQSSPDFSVDKIENEIYDEFVKNENFNDLENIEENKIEVEVKNVLEDLAQIQKSNEQNIYNFNFKSFVQKCLKVKLKDINILKIIDNIEDTINILNYQNDDSNRHYDETLSNFYQINIIKNLFKELYEQMRPLEILDIGHLSLDSDDLLSIDELKLSLLRIRLLLNLLNDEELFTDKLNYKIYDERFETLLSIFKSFIEEQNKKEFRKLIKKCSQNSSIFEIIDFFFPKHKFINNKDYNLIISYINLISELVRNKNNFSIEIDGFVFTFSPNQETEYGRIQVNLCLNKKDSFILTAGTEIKIPLNEENQNGFQIKKDVDDSETIINFINEYIPKTNINKNISEIYKNFLKKRRKNEKIKENFSSDYFFNPEKNNNIYSRAWSIIYALTPKNEIYTFLLKNYFEKEKNFFKFVEEHYNSIDSLGKIEEISNYYKKRFFYYNKNSFLWLELIESLNIENLNKDDINSKLIDIRKEIREIENINTQNESEDKLILINIQKELEKRKYEIEIDEEYRKGEKELNRIKNELMCLNVQSAFEMWKNNLIKEINDSLNLSREDMIKSIAYIKKEYENLITINEEKMFKNNIDWKISSIKSANEGSTRFQLFDIILQYNSCLEVIKKIEKIKMMNNKSEIIKISSGLNQKSELKSLIKYIISFHDYQNFDFEFANSICRASLMLNIYKNNISVEDICNFFNYLDEKKNRIGHVIFRNDLDNNEKMKFNAKNKFLLNEFIYVYKITGFYDLNMDIIIPKFKDTDIIHLFFTFENKEKYYYGPAFDNLDIINNENLYDHLYKNIKDEIKNLHSFKHIAGKIALMFYRYFNKDYLDIPEFIDGELILEYLKKNNTNKSSENYKKLNILIDLINLGIYFDKYRMNKEEFEKKNSDFKKKLTFNDFECFKDKFDIKSIMNIKNFPSFQYFLLNNYNNIEILLKTIKKENIQKLFVASPYEYIPFWVFIIRIMSSTNCLAFENNKNPLEKELTKIIRNKILLLMESKKNSDLSWINLITDEIKFPPIFNKKIHIFYIFFNKICSLENFSKDISKYINSLLIEVYKSLFDISLNQKFKDFLDTDIHSKKYSVLGFVNEPKEYIKKFINQNLSNIISSVFFESNNINYLKILEEFINFINKAKKGIKQKVEKLEIKLKNKHEIDIVHKFEEKNHRKINEREKENLLLLNESQHIYFDHYTVDDVIILLDNTEKLANLILNDIKKVKDNETIELNKFDKTFEKLKIALDKFESIYNVEEEFIDDDLKNYLDIFQKNVNSFKNNFHIFSKKFNLLPKIDTDKIDLKGFSLPLFQNIPIKFDINDIDDKLNILAQPLIIKKNNNLFCNYKKIYFNTGLISPELFNNEKCHLKIYSLVNESLNVVLEQIDKIEEKKEKNEIKNEIIENEEDEDEIIEIQENLEKNIKELYDTCNISYMKLENNNIKPESSINIEFSLPPPNTTKEEIIYRLKRNLKVSTNSSSIYIVIEIVFIVCPIQIDFSCEKYSLIFENGKYKLNTSILLKGETINFKINNIYKDNPFVLKHTIKSLDKNTYDKPEIEIKKPEELILTIKDNEGTFNDIDIMNCLLEIYISENVKIPILFDSLIVTTYFDFYIYDYESKSFITDKMNIYIPTFNEKCEIELNFLVSTFNISNIFGFFEITEISEGVKKIDSPDKMKLNSGENYFSIKLEFDLTEFVDNEIAVFEFKINNMIKKIELFQKVQTIHNVDLSLLKKIEKDNNLIDIKNINEINKNSILISPFTCWGKGLFLFRESYIDNKKDLDLEIPQNAILYYLSDEGYIEKGKENDYLIIIQIEDKWYSTIGMNKYISQATFQNILLGKLNNFFDDFVKFFPEEFHKLYNNNHLFETLLKLFMDKSNELIKDKEFIKGLIKDNQKIYDLSNKNYYHFNRDNYIFNNSKTLQTLIDAIKDTQSEYDINNNKKFEINQSINNIRNIIKKEEGSENESDENDESESENEIKINIKEDKSLNKKIIDNRFLIQDGVPIKEIIKKNSKKINALKKFIFGFSETNKIEISELNIIEKPEIITINSLIKFFDDCDLGTIVFPLYIYKAKHSKNKNDIDNMNKYFSILGNAYLSIEKNNNNLISEYTISFKKSFEYMISKLMALGFYSDKFKIPKILKFQSNEMIFTLPEKGNFKTPISEFSKKEKNNKKNNNRNALLPENKDKKNELKQIQKIKPKKQIKLKSRNNYNDEIRESNSNSKSFDYFEEKESNISNIFNKVKTDLKVDKINLKFKFIFPPLKLEMPKEIQKIFTQYNMDEFNENKKKEINPRHVEKEVQSEFGISGKDFDNTNFDEKLEIKTLIDFMKNSKKSQFIYKKQKNLIFLQDIKGILEQKEEKENDNQFLQSLINLSVPITKKLIKIISYENLQKGIELHNLEINIIFDCARIISMKQKYFYFILIIGFINALSSLEINYLFSIVGDCQFKAIIKDFNETNSKKIIKRIFECITIERYRTNIASCAKVALDEFPKLDINNKRIYYFFTNGIDDEYKLYDEWNKEIFNMNNAAFIFLFFLPIDNIESKEDYNFVVDELNKFSSKCNTKENLYTFIINDYKDIFDGKTLNDNLLKLFRIPLISNQNQKSKIDILPAKFELILNENIIKNIQDFKRDFYEYDEIKEEEIFVKKELFDFQYSIPKANKEEIKEINLKVGKTIFLPLKENISDFVKNYFKISKDKINMQLMEVIFEPNLPTEMILTDVGTQIDIYEFIKLCINPTPNPKIYRQLGDGFVKNYGLTIIIDSSYSCLGGISREHTINTIRYLLSALSYIELPSLNLIISTESNPIVICSEKGTLDALSNKSHLWSCLFYILSEEYKCRNTNLVSAIRAAYNITNARKQEHTDYLFVLTDGLFTKFESSKILEEITYCCSKNLLVIGIGVGQYPYGIEKLFPYVVFSRQPNKIIEAIALSFSDSKTNISDLSFKEPNYNDLIENNISNYYNIFKNYKSESNLVNYLKEIRVFLNSFSTNLNEINDEEKDGKLQAIKGVMQYAMYPKDSFKNKKLLIVMLYSAEMNFRENPYLSYRFIKKSPYGKFYCIQKALEFLQIQVDYAIDYETAIKKLTEDNDGYCNYYACLIFSGEPYPDLPRYMDYDLEKNNKANLVGEFVKVIIQFWKNGGGLGLFSDNAPFTFQTNLILEKLFEGDFIHFRVGGFHEGKKILKGVDSGILKEKGTFNRKVNIISNQYERPVITHCLYEMYEGNTVSYIVENPKDDKILYFGKNEDLKMITDPKKLIPFIPLSKDSDGGFNSIFYCSNGSEGDIIIDCSYTKFFLEMDKTGTPRYLMNICSWLGAIEKHEILKDSPGGAFNFKPKSIDIKIDWNAKFDRFMEIKTPILEMKTLFVVDDSGSVSRQDIYFDKVLQLVCTNYNMERGDAFYIWNQDYNKLSSYEISNFIKEKDGDKGTSSSLIAQIAYIEKKNKFEHLIIITDGDVKKEEIDKSDTLIKEFNLRFSLVSTFIIDTGDIKSESVGCPYSRDCPSFTYIVDSEGNQREISSLLKEDIEIFNNLNKIVSYNDFILKYGNIYRIFRAKCLGKNIDDELKQKFINMKNMIKVPKGKEGDFKNKIKEIEFMIDGGLRNIKPIAT